MTDLLLKASDITVTSSRITEHADGSCMGHFDISLDGVFSDVEACYDLEFSNPIENTFYRIGQYFENVEVKFSHFYPTLDGEDLDEENEETLKTVIAQYIISKL